MIDANDLINNMKYKYYKKGYKIEDMAEIQDVYNTLDRSGMPKNNFMMKLQHLIIIKEEEKEISVSGYNPKTNTITYQNDKDLYRELMHVAATTNDSHAVGITTYEGNLEDNGDSLKFNYGLSEGITDMFAEMSNNDATCSAPFEKICAEVLRNLFGLKIFEGHFNNSYDEFITSFPEDVQVDIIDLLYNLDEYQSLMKSIYSGESFPEDVAALEELTESVLRGLVTISNTAGKSIDETISFLNEKVNDPKIQSIRELTKLDQAISNINSKSL